MENKAIVLSDKQISSYLASKKKELEKFAVRQYDSGEFLRSVLLAINDSEELQKCIQTERGQTSLYNALKKAARTGLSLNPMEGEACITAFNDRVQYQIMKNGLIKLALETGKVKFITSDIVRENDDFEIIKRMGLDHYEHKIARQDRGEVDGYYAAILFKDNSHKVDYMTRKEIEEHAMMHSASYRNWVSKSPEEQKKSRRPAWVTSFHGQALKTVLKRLLSRTYISDDKYNSIKDELFAQEAPEIIDDEKERLSTDII